MNIGKVYNSYIVKKDAPLNERDVKIKAMEKNKSLQSQKPVSSYHICKALGINPANYGKFLSGNGNALSMKNVRNVLNFLGFKKQVINDEEWLNNN